MGFIRYHQMLVGVQDRFHNRDILFIRHFAKIMDSQALLVRQVQGNRLALTVEHTTTGDPVQPLFTTNGAEVFAQAIKHSRPAAWGQV
ncbi:hypothetical protein D3C80_1887500 [compost metagenome]